MRKASLALNTIVIIFFAGFLAYTYILRQHLDSLARSFVTEKTLAYSKPVIDLAEEALESPLVTKLLSAKSETAIRSEITDYENDPLAYINDVTSRRAVDSPEAESPVLEQVVSIKDEIRTYYNETLDALISDLRIFSFSNLIAGLIAFVLAYRSSADVRQPIVWFSIMMFVAVVYSSYLYVNDLTFFRILFRMHMGWWYPAVLCAMIVSIQKDSRRHAK